MGVFVCTCLILLYKKSSILVQKDDILLLLISSILFISNAYLVYVSVVYLPLSTVYSVLTVSALLFGLVVFKIFLQEPITCIKSGSVILCLIAALFVVQPDFTLYIGRNEHKVKNASANITANYTCQNDKREEVQSTIYILIFGYGYVFVLDLQDQHCM